ncbi:MAG: efflux RND transporter periplasmic adaptor subunit [Acidobacteria bacterium]|nr:efflux RND transporter periplasmic adaptor subunit [Acidobacteriota bacterium]
MPMTQYLFAAALGCAALVSTTSCARPESRATSASSPVAVTVIDVRSQDLRQTFEAGGVVRATTLANITARIMAEVRRVPVKPGDRVRAGQVLIVLDGRDLQANRARSMAGEAGARQAASMAEADRQVALAMLSLAQVGHKRVSELKAKNSATQGELDDAVAALRSAEARAKGAEARVTASHDEIEAAAAAVAGASAMASYATLTAPFDGVVTEKSVDVGSMVAPGQPLLSVEDTRRFRLDVRLDESRAALVSVGAVVRVSLTDASGSGRPEAASDEEFDGTVSEVSRMLSAESHDFLVKIEFPPTTKARSGMYGRARFLASTRPGLAVPVSALVRRGQLAFVYVVERDNRAHLRMVNAGEPSDGVVEIRSGLLQGERVVAAPSPALTDGSPVPAGAR